MKLLTVVVIVGTWPVFCPAQTISTISSVSNEATSPVSGNAGLELGQDDLRHLESLGLAGDSAAAWRISLNYFSHSDLDDERFWGDIAAQDGNAKYEDAFANMLSTYDDPYYRLRSTFWMDLSLEKVGATRGDKRDGARVAADLMAVQAIFGPEQSKELEKFIGDTRLTPSFDNLNMTPVRVTFLKMMASLGDVYAATKLVSYFENQNQYYQMYYWLNIAAENGDPASQAFLAETFQFDSEENSRIRADFWAKRILSESVALSLTFQSQNLLEENGSEMMPK